MGHTKVDYRDTDAVGNGMHFLRDPLNLQHLGLTVVEADPGWTGKEHDHSEQGHEEVYLLIEGGATVVIDDDPVDLAPGEAVKVPADATRQIRNGDEESLIVLAGAP